MRTAISKDFLSAIEDTCEKYRRSYPSKPIVKLWDIITAPLSVSQHSNISSIENKILATAMTCKNNIEVKWCIASVHRVIPMHENDMSSEEDSTMGCFNSSNLINSLFSKEAFKTDLIDNSPQFQIIYLQNLLLRSSLHSGEQNAQEYKKHSKKCLEDYAKRFLKIHERLSYSSRCYLQLVLWGRSRSTIIVLTESAMPARRIVERSTPQSTRICLPSPYVLQKCVEHFQ